MTCTVCIKTGKKNPFTTGCTNYQHSTLTRHESSNDHRDGLKNLALQKNFQTALRNVSGQDICLQSMKTQRHVTQLRTVYTMAKENIASDKFLSLMELQQVNGCSSAEEFYKKPEIVSEMEEAIADVIEKSLISDIQNSGYCGVMLDETCDISIEKKLVIYVRFIKNGKVTVAYIGNKQITDCTADGIKNSLCDFLLEKNLVLNNDYSRCMGLGTDGASVMTRCRNGLGMKLKAYNPELVQVHCVAHRLNLAASQAGKGIPYMEEYQTYIHNLYRFYSDSSVRYDKLRELQVLLHGKAKQVPEGTSVRWLSQEAAVKMVFEHYDAIILSLEDDKDKTGKTSGIWKFFATTLCLLITALLIDILTVTGILSLTFQKDNVNLSCIRHDVDSTIAALDEIRNNGSLTTNAVLGELGNPAPVGQRKAYKNIDLQDNQQLRDKYVNTKNSYIDNLINNLKRRFPDDDLDLLKAFDVLFNPRCYPPNNLHQYGDSSLDLLLGHFDSCTDEQRCRAQYLHFKHFVHSYKNILNFEQLIETLLLYHEAQYPNFATLGKIALVIPVSSAPCERGFSHQSALKNKVRNRLNPLRLSRFMLIKLVGPPMREMNFLDVARVFGAMKDRQK